MVKMEIDGKAYEFVRYGTPSPGELFLGEDGGVCGMTLEAFAIHRCVIVRALPPAVPPLPPIPDGWRLLKDDEVMDGTEFRCDGVDRRLDWIGCNEGFAGLTVRELHERVPGLKILAVIRKVAVKTRPMNREEFLKAWEERGWCPLVGVHSGNLYGVSCVKDVLGLNAGHWVCFGYSGGDTLLDYLFASDNSPCTVESVE